MLRTKKTTNILLFDLAGLDFPGGCEKYFANLAHFLSSHSTVSVVSSHEYRKFMDYVYLLVTKRKLNSLESVERNMKKISVVDIKFRSLLPFTKEHKEIKKFLLAQDTIYAKNEFQELSYLYILLGGDEFNKRVIVGVHTPIFIPSGIKTLWKFAHDVQYKSSFYRKFLHKAKKIHVNNKEYISLLVKEFKVNKQRIIHVPNPIDWTSPKPIKDNFNSYNIVWFGRFTQQKGLDRLEKILNILFEEKKLINISLIIGGSGEEEQTVKRFALKYKNVKYVGFSKEVDKYYKRADLSLFTAYYDTFAHAVLEPLSYGIPVVSSNIPGPRDMIQNKENGYLADSTEEFVKAIRFFYEKKMKDPTSYYKFKNDIYEKTNKKYDRRKIFSNLEKLFN